MRDRIVVYTALYGERDDLKDPLMPQDDCSFVCFTDSKNLVSDVFDVRVYPRINFDPVRCARFFKLLPHLFFQDYEYSIWIDGSVLIKRAGLNGLVEKHLHDSDIAMFRHSERDCVYDEGFACISCGIDSSLTINDQLNRYRNEGYPSHNGLVATGIILRRHSSPDVIRADTDWWNEVVRGSYRDQLSFNYVAWKNNLNFETIDGKIEDSQYFKVLNHAKTNPTPPGTQYDRDLFFQNRISSLETKIDALNNSLSLRVGRRIPFGKKMRKLFDKH